MLDIIVGALYFLIGLIGGFCFTNLFEEFLIFVLKKDIVLPQIIYLIFAICGALLVMYPYYKMLKK